jgi:hypothetical protein
MTKNNVARHEESNKKNAEIDPKPIDLDDAHHELFDAVSSLDDVLATLSIFGKKVDFEPIDMMDGNRVDPARPINLVMRALEATRDSVRDVVTALERDFAYEQRAVKAAGQQLELCMNVRIIRERQFLIAAGGDLFVVEPDEAHPGASSLTCVGEVSDEVFAKIDRFAKRRLRRAKAKAA